MADPWAEIGKQLVQGSDVIVGASIGAVGAFIGAGSAALAAFLADRRRFRREDEAVRRAIYAEFVLRWTLYKEAERDLLQLEPGSPQKNEEAFRVLLRAFNALSLVAPTEVREAAAKVLEEVGVAATEGLTEEEGAPGRFWKVARKDVRLSD